MPGRVERTQRLVTIGLRDEGREGGQCTRQASTRQECLGEWKGRRD